MKALHFLKQHWQRFVVGGLGLLFILVGLMLFRRIYGVSVASYLPAGNVAALLEVKIDNDHYQFGELKKFLAARQFSYPPFFADLISGNDWTGRLGGIALVANTETDLHQVYFVEYSDRWKLAEYLGSPEKMVTKQIDGVDFYFGRVGRFLFIATNPKVIEFLQEGDFRKLAHLNRYDDAMNGVPNNGFLKGFLDMKNFDNRLFQRFAFLAESGISRELVGPLTKNVSAEGFSGFFEDGVLIVESFLAVESPIARSFGSAEDKSNFEGRLLKFLDKEVLFVWAGEDFETDLVMLQKLLAGKDEQLLGWTDQLLANGVERFFGADLDLKRDVLPLLDEEFLLAVEKNSSGQPYWKLIVEMSLTEREAAEKLVEAFAKRNAAYEPTVVSHVLKDGSVMREVVAGNLAVRRQERVYEGVKVVELHSGAGRGAIYYTFFEDDLILSSSLEAIGLSIKGAGDASTRFDSVAVNAMVGRVDELIIVNMAGISAFFEGETKNFLGQFKYWISGRLNVDGGIMTINYLENISL